jgi:hypothetical protein
MTGIYIYFLVQEQVDTGYFEAQLLLFFSVAERKIGRPIWHQRKSMEGPLKFHKMLPLPRALGIQNRSFGKSQADGMGICESLGRTGVFLSPSFL